jgi:hypothetical protein
MKMVKIISLIILIHYVYYKLTLLGWDLDVYNPLYLVLTVKS